MKVYVVTDGNYSDYHICGVAASKETAERIIKYITRHDEYSDPRIEEYDTDAWIDAVNSGGLYHAVLLPNGSISVYVETYEIESGYKMRNKVKNYYNRLNVWVLARDEIHAKKIASDLFAKYKAEKLEL